MKQSICRGILFTCGALCATTLTIQAVRSEEPGGGAGEKGPPGPPVRLHRSAAVIEGKEEDARRFARQMIEYLAEHHPEVTARAFIEVSGTSKIMHGFVEARDHATLRQTRAKYFSSGEFLKLFATARGIFVESTARESLLVEVK